MRIVGAYSFNKGVEEASIRYPKLLQEVEQVIEAIQAADHKNKESKEKTKSGQMLFSPGSLNKAFKEEFRQKGWKAKRIKCEYPTTFYQAGYEKRVRLKGYREIDFIKEPEKLGIEIQFGKYSFAVYDVCLKMPIFKNEGIMDCGIEILPMKAFVQEMSSGVPYFEHLIWDLESRGVSDIDIPVMIIGIDA